LEILGLQRELLSQESHLYKPWKSSDPANTFLLSEDSKEGNDKGRVVPSDKSSRSRDDEMHFPS